MSHNVCCVAVAPIRKEPDHRSEMINQLLFGEYCIITIVQKNGWVKVVNKKDAFTGWCQASHFQEIDVLDYDDDTQFFPLDWVNEIEYNGHHMWIPFGSNLGALKNGKHNWRRNTIHFTGILWNPLESKHDAKTIKQVAFKFLNTTYLWGGRSVFGIDSSGFTQSVFSYFNIHLFRDVAEQAMQGEMISFLQEAHCGDLAFFDDEQGNIIHAGILLNEHEIIHASGKVRVDKIDSQGIINANNGERLYKLRLIKRHL